MSIPIKCRACGADFTFPDPTAGMTARCPVCGGTIKVPAATKPLKPISSPPRGGLAPDSAVETEPAAEAAPWDELLSKGLDAEVTGDPLLPPADGLAGDIPLQSPLEPPPTGGATGRFDWDILNRLPLTRSLTFLRGRWLMVFVLAATMVLFVWQSTKGSGLSGPIFLLIGLLIVGIGLLRRNESVETLLAKIFGFSLGGLLILAHLGDLVAIWSKDVPPEQRAQLMGFVGGKLLVGLVVISLLFWSCARFGFHRALAWSYIGLLVVLPIGLTTIWSHLKPSGDVAAIVDTPEAPPELTPAGWKPGLAGTVSFDLSSPPPPEFPARPPMEDFLSGVAFAQIDLGVPAGEVGQSDTLYFYLPEGEHDPQSLPCVLIAPAGSNLISGMELGEGDQPEHIPYVQAGFAVVAYEVDGSMYGETIEELKFAYEEFSRAQAGMINARNAMEYVLEQVPEVDPDRIYAVGHSSAGTLALLWAAHEPRISGCVAYAPVTDLGQHLEDAIPELKSSLPGIEDFVVGASPIEYAALLECPVMLFHSTADETAQVSNSSRLRASIMAAGGDVTLKTTRRGNHYNSMIGQGIPAAIDWLRGPALAKADADAATASETASTRGSPGAWPNDLPGNDDDSGPTDADSSEYPTDGDFQYEPPMTPPHGVPGLHLPTAAGPSEKAVRDYGRQVHVDLIVGDGAELIDRLGWLAAAKQPVVGLRWGVGVYWTGRPQQPRIASQVDLNRVTGPIGPGILAVLNERCTEGHFGDWPQQSDPQLQQAVLLGSGTRAELLDAAARHELDLLVSMELDTKAIGMTGRTNTMMRVRLVDVPTRKPLWVSKAVSSNRLMAAYQMGIDASAQFVEEIAKQIESEFCLAPMPKLQTEHVRRRVSELIPDSPSTIEALRLLAELRYYQAKELLNATEVEPLYEKILGDGNGSVLAGGEEPQRREMLEEWLRGR